MPRTADHIGGVHALAAGLRKAGKPIWAHRVNVADIWNDDDLAFEQKRDGIAARLKASSWLKGRDEFDAVVIAVEGLEQAEDYDEFNGWWDELYDHADFDRVWIAIH